MPKVTIAIPTRNRAHYLRLALDSALQQTLQDIEVVISENCCTDGTADLLATVVDPRVRILRQPADLTMVQNWNACVDAASGQYFLLLSDDDVLEPRALEAMVQAFETGPDPNRTGFVYCRGRMIDGDGKLIRPGMRSPLQEEAPELIVAFFEGRRETWPCSILLRRSDLADGYSSDFLLITDAAAWMKAVCRHGLARFVDEELVNYRAHNNLTRATPIAVWQRENANVAALAIRSLREACRSNPALEQKIERAVRRLNMQITLALPLSAPGKSRSTVLRTYFKYLPLFLTSGRGLFMLTRAVVVVTLPQVVVRLVQAGKRRFRPS